MLHLAMLKGGQENTRSQRWKMWWLMLVTNGENSGWFYGHMMSYVYCMLEAAVKNGCDFGTENLRVKFAFFRWFWLWMLRSNLILNSSISQAVVHLLDLASVTATSKCYSNKNGWNSSDYEWGQEGCTSNPSKEKHISKTTTNKKHSWAIGIIVA